MRPAEAALRYLERGWYCVPIPPRKKGPVRGGWQTLRLTPAEIPSEFADDANLGILTGAASGNLIDLDLDCEAAVRLARDLAPRTGMKHGRASRPSSHYWYLAGGTVTYLKLCDPEPPGKVILELRQDGHQTLAPPSIHPDDGEPLAWEGQEPGAAAPEELEAAARRIAAGALLADRWSRTSHAGDPIGHTAGLALAGFFLRRWTLEQTQDFLGAVAEAAGGSRRKVEADVRDTWKKLQGGAGTTGMPTLRQHFSEKVLAAICSWLGLEREASASAGAQRPELTDLFNARLFVEQHGQDVRFVHDARRWYVYDGRRWTPDSSGEVERRAKQTVESLYGLASNEPDEDRRNAIRRHALKSQDGHRIESLLKLARSEEQVAITSAVFDTNAWLFNCENGTIDLRSGGLRPHSRAQMLTKLAPVAFDPEAESPRWSAFLRKIMAENPELVAFLQRAIGYSMTGDTSEQKFFVNWGGGANGKSTLLRTAQTMLGDYAISTSIETLVVRHGSGASNDVARLAGARFVCAVEAEEGQRLAEERVKHLTGGDAIAARFLYQEHFEFRPTFKLWLATNHRPQVRGTDEAIWRRINLVPFTVAIPEAEQDRRLPDKLQAELPGILAWSVAGCLLWQAHGLREPQEVRDATADYRRAEDIIGGFIDECCYLEPTASTPARELYAAYLAWCQRAGEKAPLSQKKLGPRLRERNLEASRDVAGRYAWRGVGLNPSGGLL